MLVKIEQDQVSSVVSRELQYLYDHAKKHKDFVVDAEFDMTQEELLKALTSIIEYYTIPSEFDIWKEQQA